MYLACYDIFVYFARLLVDLVLARQHTHLVQVQLQNNCIDHTKRGVCHYHFSQWICDLRVVFLGPDSLACAVAFSVIVLANRLLVEHDLRALLVANHWVL